MSSQTFSLAAFNGPHVRALADYMDVSEDYARGLLLRWWSECESMIDKAMNLEGFARGLIHAGLLVGVEEAAQANGEARPAKPVRRRKAKPAPIEQPAEEAAREPEVVATATAESGGFDLKAQAESIYQQYPRRVAKPRAIPAIKKAIKAIGYANLAVIVSQYRKATEGADLQYIPHPATWFNQERYNDDPQTWTRGENGKDLFGGIRQVQRELSDERGVQARRLFEGDGGVAGGNSADGNPADDQGLSSLPF